MASGERVAHLVVNQNAKAAKLIAKLVRSRVVAFPPRLDASCEAGVHECLPLCVHQRHRPARRSPAQQGTRASPFFVAVSPTKASRDDETRIRTDTSSAFSLGTRSCTLVRTLSLLVRVGDTIQPYASPRVGRRLQSAFPLHLRHFVRWRYVLRVDGVGGRFVEEPMGRVHSVVQAERASHGPGAGRDAAASAADSGEAWLGW